MTLGNDSRRSTAQRTATRLYWVARSAHHGGFPVHRIQILLLLVAVIAVSVAGQETSMKTQAATASTQPTWMTSSNAKLETELTAKYGDSQKLRLQRGLKQVSEFWRAEDGDAAAYEDFIRTNFAGDQATLDTMFNRYQRLLEQLDGHMHEIN